jgi:hypothetical protein
MNPQARQEYRAARWLIRTLGYEVAYAKAFERAHRLEHFGRDWGGRERGTWRAIWTRVCKRIEKQYHLRTRPKPITAARRMTPLNVRSTY